ncbi:LpqB family beta-propeller domain-containing protein [Xylanimonas ulmi]|uniref:Lipoprotein LpqB-like beta-propeller protein n=1 Tax=Xylanimonas ulmi TaxID=228973 RepID=A0A4Q7M275_9MICO|nr:LpqB family beta-propeller domain-containing protein [Xylanibacterium ulmi]RZS60009.1 lipoprotein LpqB-like beta-propeller protein [Xylanibacterium ulmi]
MSGARRLRAAVAAAVAAALLAGCSAIPVSGRVQEGGTDVRRDPGIGFIAESPVLGAEPDAIVRGFLLAAQAGPTSTTPFSVALEYLTAGAGTTWKPYAQVFVLDGVAQLTVSDTSDDQQGHAVVHASGTVVASLDEQGVLTEEPTPISKETTFELTKESGQWRIDSLEDGLLVPSQVFTTTFHRTRLNFLSPDQQAWVPDVRWFPQQSWRTNAVREILAGPPDWLGAAVEPVLPAGTALALNSVTDGPDGNLQVSLTDQISEASATARGLFVAQLRATLSDGTGESIGITLLDRNGPIAPSDVASLTPPRPSGPALVLRDGALWSLAGRELVQSDTAVSLGGLDPTALAVGSGGAPVVVRDGAGRLVRVTGDPTALLQGTTLLAPSVDRFGAVWSGEPTGPIQVVLPSGGVYPVAAPWLDGRTVTSLAVSPEGARVALVSVGQGGTQVQVAGVVRDVHGVPTALARPLIVGQSVAGVTQAVWQDETALALLGQGEGSAGVYLAGVGGLAGSAGGLARRVPGVNGVTALSASVGTGDILALDAQGVLYLHQASAVWPVIGQDVSLMAFPG